MAEIPLPLSSAPGTRPQEGAGRLLNVYAEPPGDTAASSVLYRRSPGLANFGTTARSGIRALMEINGTLYSAWSGQLERHSSSGGVSTTVGSLSGTARGFFARNNKVPTPDMVFCDTTGFVTTFTSGSVFGSYPDPDLPAPNSVCSIDGYFVFSIGDGRCFASNLNDTPVAALSFAKAEAKPDGLRRAVAFGNVLVLFGTQSTEFWTDVGTIPFPFARSVVIPRGLAGSHCVAGHEDGWGKNLIWVADDNTVVKLDGYTPNKVSPPDLDRLIEAVSDKSTLEASCYMSSGHPFWQLSSPTWTWVFDLNTSKWHERDSYLQTRSRISMVASAFGNLWLCGDTKTGNIQQIVRNVYKEVNDPLRVRIESGPVENFPAGGPIGRADFMFTTGVGNALGQDPIETRPRVEISWSDDGGASYSAPLLRELGRQGETRALVSLIACTGRTSWNGRRWRIDQMDPVHFGLMTATQSIDPRVMA